MLQVGFDIGGTNIKVGVVNEEMKIVASRRQPFPTGEKYEKVADIMEELVREMAEELDVSVSEFQSIGIAIPGSLDPECKIILDAYNLHFHNVPMKQAMEERFPGIPVFLGNDANVAALAELHCGAFVGSKTAVLMTLGTGVGGGLILDGKMFNGGTGHGVELGHMVLQEGGERCSCGNRGCVESYCAATWLVRQGRKAVIEHPLSMIHKRASGDMKRVTAKLVVDCAKAGDYIAKDIFHLYLDYLSSAIVSICVLLGPEVIALGGGVSLAGDFLYRPLRKMVNEKSFFKGKNQVVPAKLGNDAGILGAAMLKWNAEQSR
ncbi:MAG: ROK family protein [Anaerovorax sp.]|nr:ROK family protein [Anaerovorax sp.]